MSNADLFAAVAVSSTSVYYSEPFQVGGRGRVDLDSDAKTTGTAAGTLKLQKTNHGTTGWNPTTRTYATGAGVGDWTYYIDPDTAAAAEAALTAGTAENFEVLNTPGNWCRWEYTNASGAGAMTLFQTLKFER
jgi:hypothetical protein